jgi:hypothetical protein
MYPFMLGVVAGILLLGLSVPSGSDVCRAAYHAPNDQSIAWKDGACVRVITSVQSLEAPTPATKE